jgi:preprotein translocase subunit SecD
MVIARTCFNLYLLLSFAVLLGGGCSSTKKERAMPLSTLRIHMEVSATPMDFSVAVPIYRAHPVTVVVNKDPFLTEAHVASAKVMQVLGGFDLRIEFDHSGALLLEQYTTANPGRHIAIFSQFGKTKEESRWLAAPAVGRRVTNGVLIFTPDASREEAERVALGLNNFHVKEKAKSRW